MNRLPISALSLCLLIGFLLGAICPTPWDSPEASGTIVSAAAAPAALLPAVSDDLTALDASGRARTAPLDPADNTLLLHTAGNVLTALKSLDYAALADLVHPTRGVTFTPYSTVNFETDLTFTPQQIRDLSQDKTTYVWGTTDGRGTLIELTMSQYMEQYVFHTDYTQAPHIGIDRIIVSGNALENLTQAYPFCRFVDYSFPSVDPNAQGLDWCSLKLVFEPGESSWMLVGIIHGQWTV